MIPCEYICTPIRAGAGKRASHPETIAEFRPRAEAALSFVDQTVKDQPFLVGDHCTIADIGLLGPHGVHVRGWV